MQKYNPFGYNSAIIRKKYKHYSSYIRHYSNLLKRNFIQINLIKSGFQRFIHTYKPRYWRPIHRDSFDNILILFLTNKIYITCPIQLNLPREKKKSQWSNNSAVTITSHVYFSDILSNTILRGYTLRIQNAGTLMKHFSRKFVLF